MSKLTIHENERSTVYEILEDSLVIGTRQGCAIRVSDPVADPEHCQVSLVPGVGYKLIDLESREGTKVNGAYVNQHLLREGDVIQIGAVRIGYAGAAPAASAPGPAPAPVAAAPVRPVAAAVPARPAAVPARPAAAARAPARPQYAGYPSAPPRDYRPPRRSRGGDSGPIILMGVAVGLLLVVVIVIAVMSSGGASGNEQILMEMEQLMANNRWQDAINLAGQADPSGDPTILEKIRFQKNNAEKLKNRKGGKAAEDAALVDYQRVESYIQQHRHDIPGTIREWQAMIERHPGTHWAYKAKLNLDHLLAGGKNPEGITLYPGGGATIDRAFTEVQGRSQTLEDDDKFQASIDAFFDFWEEYKLKTTDLATWEKRVLEETRGVERRAEARWESLDSLAKQYVKNGQYDAAKRMYRKVTDNFGIEKYVVQADAALKKIQH